MILLYVFYFSRKTLSYAKLFNKKDRQRMLTAFFHYLFIVFLNDNNVFFISIAIVIGPTPPGTGVI